MLTAVEKPAGVDRHLVVWRQLAAAMALCQENLAASHRDKSLRLPVEATARLKRLTAHRLWHAHFDSVAVCVGSLWSREYHSAQLKNIDVRRRDLLDGSQWCCVFKWKQCTVVPASGNSCVRRLTVILLRAPTHPCTATEQGGIKSQEQKNSGVSALLVKARPRGCIQMVSILTGCCPIRMTASSFINQSQSARTQLGLWVIGLIGGEY